MTTTVSAPGAGGAGRRRVAGLVGRRLLDAGLLIFLATAIIAFSLLSPYFLSVRNFMNILLSVAIVGIVGGGMTLVVIAGESTSRAPQQWPLPEASRPDW